MLKWSLFTALALVGVAGVITVVGLMLPRGHHASRSVTLAAPPLAVFGVVSDVAHGADWRPDVKSIEMLPDDGKGRRFKENGSNGPITYRVEVSDPSVKFVTRIADPSLAFGGSWTFDLEPAGSGTELTITEDGEVYNPIFRFMSRFFFSPTATMETYIAALRKKLGES